MVASTLAFTPLPSAVVVRRGIAVRPAKVHAPCLRAPARRRGSMASKAPTIAAAASPDQKLPPGADAVMETTRKDMRTVFDVDRWVKHRSTDRYFRHMVGIFSSRVLLGLYKPLAYVVGMAVGVCAYGEALKANLLPIVLPAMDLKVKELFGMTSFALALLLVFRTNASYGRWDEARKMWGMVLNRTRDICRLALTWISDDKRELRAMMCRWAPAYSKALMCHLRRGEDLRGELEGLLLPHEIDGVLRATHRPNYVLQVLSQIVKAAELPTAATLKMEEDLAAYEDSLGGCERILRTPIPLFYTRHTSRFLMIWLTCLPLALAPSCGWATVPLTFLISFLLLGIDKIGVSIEEPFSILALEVIAGTALANVRELVAMHDSVGAALGAASENNSNGNGNGNGSNGNGSKINGHSAADVSAANMVALAGVAA